MKDWVISVQQNSKWTREKRNHKVEEYIYNVCNQKRISINIFKEFL